MIDDKVIIFERKELIELKRRASALGDIDGLNPSWQRALYNLATAADHLDAMIARSTEEEQEI